MDFFDQTPEETKDPFVTDEEINQSVQKTQRYLKGLSESLALAYDIPLAEAEQSAQTSTDQKYQSMPNLVDVYEEAYRRKADPEGIKTMLDNLQKSSELLGVVRNPVVAKAVTPDPILSPPNRLDRTMAILDQSAQEHAPEEGWFGLFGSGVGTLVWGMTGGVLENAAGFFGTGTEGWDRAADGQKKFLAVYNEDDPRRAKALADQYMKEAQDLGLFGSNSLRYWQDVQTMKSMGSDENAGINFALDIAGVIPVSRVSKLLPFANDAVSTAAAVGGNAAANRAMGVALNSASTSTNIGQHSAPAVSRVINTGLHPSISPTLQSEVFNDALESVAGTFKNQYISQDQVQEVAQTFIGNIRSKIKSHVNDYEVTKVDNFDNRTIRVDMGKDDGTKFIDRTSASNFQTVLNNHYGITGEVRETFVNGVSDGWVVSYTKNLPLKNFAKPITPADMREYGVFDYILSPELISSQDMLTLRKTGVKKVGVLEEEVFRKHTQILDKVSTKDLGVIDTIVEDARLRKGDWLNTSDFKAEYNRLTNKDASDEVVNAYHSKYKITETDAFIRADKILKDRLREGIVSERISFDGNTFYTAKAKLKNKLPQLSKPGPNNPNPQTKLYDFDTGQEIDVAVYMKNKGRKVFYHFDNIDEAPVINGKTVVYGIGTPKKSRPLTHQDVYKHLPGGPKNSQKLEGFLIQRSLVQDLSGNTLNKLPNIIAAGRTTKELNKILNDINEISRVYLGTTDQTLIRQAIKKHNGFNPSIETVQDFERFVQEVGLDLNSPLELVRKSDFLPEVGTGYGENYFNGKFKTYSDMYERGTGNNYVYGYGNISLNQLEPTRVLNRDFAKSVNYMANRSANVNHIEGIIRGAEAEGVLLNKKNIKGMALSQQLRNAEFSQGKAGDLYRAQQRVLIQQLNEPSQFSQRWDQAMKNIANTIFDKTGIETFDILSKNPVLALRSMAFHMKLGLFNPNQLILQSFQAMNIIAISPRFGFKAAAAYWPMRAALMNGSDEVMKAAAKRIAPMLDITEDQFLQMSTYYRKTSGFYHITDNIYENTPTMGITRGMVRQVKEGSTVFFREGERIAKGMATSVAYQEFLKKPGITLVNGVVDLSDEVTSRAFEAFMTKRVDDLTFNMTRVSAAGWQEGVLGLATQWQSYSSKVFENLVFGRNLSSGERTRLALMQVGLFGAAGIPFGNKVMNIFTDSSEDGIDPKLYTLLQGGLLDTMLSQIVGEETAMSERVSPVFGMQKTLTDIYDKNFLEVLGGPSTTIAYKLGDLGFKMLYSRVLNEPSVADMDLTKLLREISSFDAGVRAYYLFKLGIYVNKRGEEVASGFSPWASVANVLGTDFQKVTLQYTVQDLLKKEKDAVYQVANRVNELERVMQDAVEAGDMETARSINNSIIALKAPFSPSEQKDINSLTRESFLNTTEKLLKRDQKTVRSGLGRQLEQIQK